MWDAAGTKVTACDYPVELRCQVGPQSKPQPESELMLSEGLRGIRMPFVDVDNMGTCLDGHTHMFVYNLYSTCVNEL